MLAALRLRGEEINHRDAESQSNYFLFHPGTLPGVHGAP
jgi:hypothetical protein